MGRPIIDDDRCFFCDKKQDEIYECHVCEKTICKAHRVMHSAHYHANKGYKVFYCKDCLFEKFGYHGIESSDTSSSDDDE